MKRYLVSALAGLTLLAGGAAPAGAADVPEIIDKGELNNANFEEWFAGSPAARISTMGYWAEALPEDDLKAFNNQELGLLLGLSVECVQMIYNEDPDTFFSPRIIGVKCLRYYSN